MDRPANPNCQLVLAKSVDGEKDLIQVEEWLEKKEGEEDFTQEEIRLVRIKFLSEFGN